MKKILVFDIETIVDTSVVSLLCPQILRDLPDISSESDECRMRRAIAKYHEQYQNTFARQLFHKIVSLSYLVADFSSCSDGFITKYITTSGRRQEDDSKEYDINDREKKSLEGFYSFVNKESPLMITFNGRVFDIPVIKYRAMKYGISMKRLLHKDYSYRYSLDHSLDLLEVFSDFGISAKVKLSEVCALLSIPCKYGIDGGKVAEEFDKGNLSLIQDYCETDTLVTFIIYLRYCVLNGTLDSVGYNKSIDSVIAYVELNCPLHLCDFLYRWKELSNIYI